MAKNRAVAASFRDPAGFVFEEDGLVKRAVTRHGQRDFDLLESSGLYEALTRKEWLIPHEAQASHDPEFTDVLVPEQLPFISYPYEWCFSQLKDAAILTLEIQLLALEHHRNCTTDAAPPGGTRGGTLQWFNL